MDQKLSLKLNKSVIEDTKKQAKKHQKSPSRIIENDLKAFTSLESDDKFEITPLVRSMSSSPNSKTVPLDAEKNDRLRDNRLQKTVSAKDISRYNRSNGPLR